jgi:uncharacterized membrane protein (UPF0127 family)
MQLVNISKGTLLAERLTEARAPWSRLVGLLGRSHLSQGEGLLIAPCSSVHTFFMRFPIDVAFLDRDGRVVSAFASVPPFRVLMGGRGAQMAVELPAGVLARTGATTGDQLVLRLEAPGD